MPEAHWQEVFALTDLVNHPDWEMHQQVVVLLERLRNADHDKSMSAFELNSNIFYDVLTTWENLRMYARPGGPPVRFRVLPDWITGGASSRVCGRMFLGVMPAIRTNTKSRVLSLILLKAHGPGIKILTLTILPGIPWCTQRSGIAKRHIYLSVEPRILYSTQNAENVLVRR